MARTRRDRGWSMIGLHTPKLDVHDHHGRRYRVGEQPRELAGRPRGVLLWACWLPMLLAGTMQYAFGAAIPALTAAGHDLGWLCATLACWTVFQAGAGYPVAHLRQRDRLDPRTVLIGGGILCAAGVLTLGHVQSPPGLLLGYSVLGGTGAGLVYAVCTSTAQKWFPESPATRVGFVTGAFAYGSAPFVLALAASGQPREIALFAPVLLVAVTGCGLLLTDPPRDWWPAHVDHRSWARANPPAAHEFSATEALRTPALPAMAACLFCAATVSLFNAVFLALLAGPWAAALFVATNGAGRALAMPLATRFGRRRVLRRVVAVQAAGQVLLLLALTHASHSWLLTGATVAGIGGGAFYPILAALARELFGQRRSAEVHGLIYSAKAASGVVGIGFGFLVLAQQGPALALLVATLLSLAAAAVCGLFRRPGLPKTLPSPRTGT
ncbi:OFA family MFS transporter [Saccharopolyspora halophila]|uniref:OFA family MFS transporter n=1 Tax=Saccharopolyspora halophila TaxID=405551 RepID=A0ABN3GKD4_9PSEU